MKEHKLSVKQALPFILGGKALFTLRSVKTGKRFTYKVKSKPGIFFVSLLTGPDNMSNYKYIGFIKSDPGAQFVYGNKSKISITSEGVGAFIYVWNHVILPQIERMDLEIWHQGKCGRCGRTLTVPESIENGFGPECIKFVKL